MNEKIISAEVFGNYDTGLVRKNNEDNFVATFVWGGNYILAAAIDGVGGYEGGEVAAEIAKVTIEKFVSESDPGSNPLDVIKDAVVEANNTIMKHKATHPELSQMGCVLTAAIIDLNECLLYMAHVGDSRLYQYSDGKLTKLSHDHSIIGYREEIGDLTEEEAMHHPQRNLIERLLGDTIHCVDDKNFIDAAIVPFNITTQFLFCSDGLSDMLTSKQISSCLNRGYSPQEEVSKLIELACAAGGKDNITAVVARIVMNVDSSAENTAAFISPDTRADVITSTATQTAPAACSKTAQTEITQPTEPTTTVEEADDPTDKPQKKRKKGRRSIRLLAIAFTIVLGVALAFLMLRVDPKAPEQQKAANPSIEIETHNELASAPADSTPVDSAALIRSQIEALDSVLKEQNQEIGNEREKLLQKLKEVESQKPQNQQQDQ